MKYTVDEVKAIQAECGVNTVFTQNSKMKKSSKNGIHIYNFGIPAYKSTTGVLTCPNASKCIAGCYAKAGAYLWSNVAQAYENRLALTRTKGFSEVIEYHVAKLRKKHKSGVLLIRVHDSGDFYSAEYQKTWYAIARLTPNVQFYAYTKMIEQSKSLESERPSNFTLIYSYGGKQDTLIDAAVDRHARVFESESELACHGYSDASDDDVVAAMGPNAKIGLVYHGTKSYKNTTWSKVNALP